jgi:hypothetical protein
MAIFNNSYVSLPEGIKGYPSPALVRLLMIPIDQCFPHCTEVDTVKGENTQLREELTVESWCVMVFAIPGNPQESLPCSILMYSLPQKPCFRTESMHNLGSLNWRYFQGMGRLPPKARDHERVWRQENNVLKDYLNNLMAKVRVLCSVKLFVVHFTVYKELQYTHILCVCIYIYVNMHVSIHDFGSYLILGIFIPFTLRYMLRLLRTSVIEVMRMILHKSCHQWLSFHDFSCGSGSKWWIYPPFNIFNRHFHGQNHGRD